ncbi:MAG: hypothetical protein ACYC6Y_26380, partial [Thermoguttaceae bacterium]
HRVGQIFGDSQMADREKDSVLSSSTEWPPQLPMPVPPADLAAPARPSHTVRVISGAKVQEVVMQSQEDESEPATPNGSASTAGSPTSFLWKIISGPSKEEDQVKPDANPEPAPDAGEGTGAAPEPGLEPTSKAAEPDDIRAPKNS